MHKCFKCGTEFEGNFCPECGTKFLEEKRCPQCGAVLAGSAKFCNNCGYAFVETEEKKPKKANPTLQKIGAFFKRVRAWIKAHLKIVIPTACAAVVLIVMLSLIPTFIVASVNGTYYAYSFDENGELQFYEKDFITLSTGKWTDGETKGTYSVSGKNITLTYIDESMKELGEMFGEDVDAKVELKGTVKNGVLTVMQGQHELVFAKKKHKHKYGKWEVAEAATCTEKGEKVHTCACKKVETEIIAALGHNFRDGTEVIAAQCDVNGLKTYVCRICNLVTEIVIPATGHKIFSNGFCTVCSAPQLIYTLDTDKTSYSVTGVTSGANIETVKILAEYNGKPVTSIGNNAFRDCNGLKKITIPSSVTSIGNNAFRNCNGLTSITIPDSVTSIGNYAFEYCWELTSITIPNGVVRILGGAFNNCSRLTSITIPSSVASIESYAFTNCSRLTNILFEGTKAQWKAIEKKNMWVSGAGITIQCTDGKLDEEGNEIE